MQVENTSKNTEIAQIAIKDIQAPQSKWYTSSKEDEALIWFIKARKTLMAQKRSPEEKKWKQYVKQYEALFVPYSDGRAASNVPLERSIIELFVAEAVKRPTTYSFSSCLWYEFQEQVFKRVWKNDWSINNRNSVILENEYLTAIFGTSIVFTWYNKSYRVFSDFDGVDDAGEIQFKRKLQTKSDIIIQNVDIRDFWVDDRANSIEDAVDCIYETYITYEEFLSYKLDKWYDKEKLNAIIPNSTKYDSDRAFVFQSETGDTGSKYVKITKYWNTKLDMYVEVANDSIVLIDHPILNATHDLPFVVRQYAKNLFSFYGTGLCEILVSFKSDINKLREMLMEAIKKSNQEVIAIGSNLTFDWNQFAYNNQFMKFKGNLQGNFHQLTWTPPNQSIFTYLQQLYKDVAIYGWLDIQNILWDPQQTAYQTAVQKESSLQRINVVLKNRDSAFERLANLHKDNLQMFYPLKLVRKLVEVDEKNEPIEEVETEYPTIEVPKMKGKKFWNGQEKQLFEITPESIRWSIKLEVSTDLNAPTITEVEKEQKMQFFRWVAELTNAYTMNPKLEEIIPMKKAISDMAKLNNIETEEAYQWEVQEKKKELYAQMQEMMKWVRSPGTPVDPNQALAWEQENLAAVSAEWQPPEIAAVRTPTM